MLDEKNLNPEELEIKDETIETTRNDKEDPSDLVEEIVDLGVLVNQDEIKGAHDEFDWSIGSRNSMSYSDEQKKAYTKDYSGTFNSIMDGQVLMGRVAGVTGNSVILDINYKSDGLVAKAEFRDLDIKPGDLVEVYVEKTEDEKGHLVLSRKKAKLLRAWENLVDSYRNGTVIKGTVISKTKGGLIVDCNGLETFLPGSQIDIKPITDYDSYVGKLMEFKVVKINETIKNAVVSHKALIEGDLQEQREQIISTLEKGQVLEGTVKNITDFGAFLDLGGVDGLLYITDISWGRINHPMEVLEKNQKVNVVVLDFDENKKRISLGLKQLQPHPWDVMSQEIVEGSIVKGKIVNIEDYGAFLEIQPGVEGLIHVSEVNWNSQPVHAKDFFFLGQELEAKVVTLDREERKMSLSLKQLTEDPWTKIYEKFPVGSRHTGTVKNLTPYGVFVELTEGIGGMVHISDLSWTKRYNHPSEYTKVGNQLDILILEIDTDNRKLSLGHKQLEENPWDTFETVFPVGSYHEATVIRKDDRGYTVQMPYGLEAYAPVKHMKKEDNTQAAMDEHLTVKVIEFNRDDKKIMVSHARYLEDIKKAVDENVKKEKEVETQKVKKAVEKQQSKMEISTLGELEGFASLKEQFREAQTKFTPPPPPPPPPAEQVEAPQPAAETVSVQSEPLPVVEETTPAAAEPKAKSAKGDDLKIIEGIGPKIAELLVADGINSFEALANASQEQLHAVLEKGGSRYKMHDPGTWPQQAALASKGEWDALKALQESLKGGKTE